MTPAELTAIRARDASWTESIANSNYIRGPESSLPYDSGSQCVGDRRALLAAYDALAISKGREEAKQLVINQLEAALRAVMAASFSQDSTYKIAERALPRSKVTAAQSDRGEKR